MGEYGISTNPESFASEAYRVYFTDKVKGVVLRLSKDGLTPISEHGMKDWFRDHLKLSTRIIGSFDDRQAEYNVKIGNDLLSFNENVRGWTSFKSFIGMEGGVSCAGEYYTFKTGKLYKHHDENVDRNTFYGVRGDSWINVLLNDSSSSIKTFHTLNYEGSQSKVDELITYNTVIPGTTTVTGTYSDGEYYNLAQEPGWYVQTIKTDQEEGSVNEFIEKEGKWFNYIKGNPGSVIDGTNITSGLDNADSSFQGIGMLIGNPTISSAFGCTDGSVIGSINNYDYPLSTNYDPMAVVDDGSCIPTVPGCTDDGADANYNVHSNWDIYSETGTYAVGACQYWGCMEPSAINYDSDANYPSVTCIWPIYGCMINTTFDFDGITYNTFTNFDINATDACDGVGGNYPGFTPIPCVNEQTGTDCCCNATVIGCMDPTADNYSSTANTEPADHCTYTIYGCTDANSCDYDATATADDGSCTFCYDFNANNYDGTDGQDPIASCDTYCLYCKIPDNLQATTNTTTSSIQVSWDETFNGNAAVDFYKLRYKKVGSSVWTVINNIQPNNTQSTVTYDVTGLDDNQEYEISIKTVCSAGTSILNPTYFTSSDWTSNITEYTEIIAIMGCLDNTGIFNGVGSWAACNFDADANADAGGVIGGSDASNCDYTTCTGCMDVGYEEYCSDCWDPDGYEVTAPGLGMIRFTDKQLVSAQLLGFMGVQILPSLITMQALLLMMVHA
jgi:hypothetical protein